jgi:hypothetical protein
MTKAHSASHVSSDLGLLCRRSAPRALLLLAPIHGPSPINLGFSQNCISSAITIR